MRLELLARGIQLLTLGIQLSLLLVEGRELGGGGAACLSLRAGGIQLLLCVLELSLSALDLGSGGVELCLSGLELRASLLELGTPVGDLLLLVGSFLFGLERVDDPGDVGQVADACSKVSDLRTLFVAERLAIFGVQHDLTRGPRIVGELLGELVGYLARCGSGNVETRGQRAGAQGEGAARETENRDPGDDHDPRALGRSLAEPVQQFSHGHLSGGTRGRATDSIRYVPSRMLSRRRTLTRGWIL